MIDALAPALRARASRWGADKRYDFNQLQRFEAVLNRSQLSLKQFRSILEFGCGYGRLTRHLFSFVPRARISGCDISAQDILWCRKKYPEGQFVTHSPRPPFSFADEEFDLIYSYSVFTHLSEENHLNWLKELSRVLKPGGVMLHTVHSPLCLERIQRFSPERLANYGLGGTLEEFLRSGKEYHYISYGPDQPEYGLTILTKEYVSRVWTRQGNLRLLDFIEGAIEAYPEGCQDLVVLKKEGPSA